MYIWCSDIYVLMFTIGYHICDMSISGCASAVVHGYVDIAKVWLRLCVYVTVHVLYPPSYDIARCGSNMIIWQLSDDRLPFTACDYH